MGGGGGLRRAGCRCWYLLCSDSSSTSVSSISGMLWMRSLMRNSGWAMKLWMELRESGFSRPSYSELRNAFTTRIYQKEGGRKEGGKKGEKESTRKRVSHEDTGGESGKPRGRQSCVLQQTDRQTDRQTNRQTNEWTHRIRWLLSIQIRHPIN